MASYVDANKYYELTGQTPPSMPDPRIDGLLEMAEALYDRLHGVARGHFAPQSSGTYTFPADGGRILRLRDSDGMQHFLQTITADSCLIDDDADGSFDDFSLDLSDAWLKALPENAATLSQPYTRLELLPLTSAPITQWPNARYCVRITGTWGWSATPYAVQTRVVDIAHALSQRSYAGGYGTDESLRQEVFPAWLMRMVDFAYDYSRKKSA